MQRKRSELPSDADYRACADEGLTAPETALRLGVSRTAVYVNGRKLGLPAAAHLEGRHEISGH